MPRPLGQEQIDALAVQIARDVAGADLMDLYKDPAVQQGIHLGAIVTKDAMLAGYEGDAVRSVPEGVDS